MKDNKLIAEFMGFQKTNIGWYDSEETMPPLSNTYDSNTFDEHELAFHKSWDWLMPVVEKCRVQSNAEDSYWEAIYYSLEGCDIDVTHHAVVEFIKQYNK